LHKTSLVLGTPETPSQNPEFKTPNLARKMSNSHSLPFKYNTIRMESTPHSSSKIRSIKKQWKRGRQGLRNTQEYICIDEEQFNVT